MKTLVANVDINNDEVHDLDNEDALCINVVPEDSDSTHSGTHDYYDTYDGHEGYKSEEDDDSDYEPSDQEDDMDDQSPHVNQALRKLKSNLDEVHWSCDESAYSHMVLAMIIAE